MRISDFEKSFFFLVGGISGSIFTVVVVVVVVVVGCWLLVGLFEDIFCYKFSTTNDILSLDTILGVVKWAVHCAQNRCMPWTNQLTLAVKKINIPLTRILRTGVEGLEEYLEDFDEPMTSLHF